MNDTSTRSNPSGGATNISVDNPVVHDDDDLGLFSNLYTDAPPTATTTHDTAGILEDNCSGDEDEHFEDSGPLRGNPGVSEHVDIFSAGEGSNFSHCNTFGEEAQSFTPQPVAHTQDLIRPGDSTAIDMTHSSENHVRSEPSSNGSQSSSLRSVNSVETQTASNVSNDSGRPSPRSSLALVFRRALGRSAR
jgi:hypothetical protein